MLFSGITTTTRGRINVPKIKVHPDGRVKIPSSLAKKYHLQEGDTLDVRDIGGGIIFIPEKIKQNKELRKELNDRIWDQMEEEADEDIKSGRVSGPFETAKDLLRDLKS